MKNWKKLLNAESPEAHWEITNYAELNKTVLHYVPLNDYSEKDVKIELPQEHFEDLCNFIKKLSS